MAESVQWVMCDRCEKWRVVDDPDSIPEVWYCEMNEDEEFNSCDILEQLVQASSSSAAEVPNTSTSQAIRRGGSGLNGNLAPEVELENMLKSLPIERLKELWLSFDWATMVEAKKPPKLLKLPIASGTTVDDRVFVRSLDAAVKRSLPKGLAAQTPPLVSLYEQQQALIKQLALER